MQRGIRHGWNSRSRGVERESSSILVPSVGEACRDRGGSLERLSSGLRVPSSRSVVTSLAALEVTVEGGRRVNLEISDSKLSTVSRQ